MTSTTIRATKDHDFIKNWIEKNGGVPARLGYDSSEGLKDPLTVWFRKAAAAAHNSYQALDWEEFFAVFDYHDFVFQYEEQEGEGSDKFIAIQKAE